MASIDTSTDVPPGVSVPGGRAPADGAPGRGAAWRGQGTAFLIFLVLTPLPLGSNRALWWTLAAVVAALLLMLYAVRLWRSGAPPAIGLWPILGIVLPFFAALGWALIQALPLAPDAWAHPWTTLAGEGLGAAMPATISLHPHESLTGVMRLLTYGAVFFLALQFGRERAFAERAVRWIAYVGLGYAAYGLLMDAAGINRVLWLEKWAYEGFLTSTFVNRNSYASYAALGLLCAAALLLDAARDTLRRPKQPAQMLAALVESLTARGTWPLVASAVLGVALIQTGSRMGALSTLLGLGLFVALAARAELLRPRHALLAIGLLSAGAALFLALTGGAVTDRLEGATLAGDRDARAEIYATTLRALGDEPVLGTGLGTFSDVFALYRDATFDPFMRPSQAHSTYLENALELGVPASILLMAALAAVGEANFMGLRRRRRGRLFPALGLATLAALALHALVDFSLEIPAVSITLAAILGVACAQSYRSGRRGGG